MLSSSQNDEVLFGTAIVISDLAHLNVCLCQSKTLTSITNFHLPIQEHVFVFHQETS